MNENSITINKNIYESLKQENQYLKAELRWSQQLFQLVINNIPHSVFWKDRSSIFLGCNRNFAEDANVGEPENIIGKNDYDCPWTKEESDFFRECDKRVMDNGVPEVNIIETQVQADGNLFWLDTNKIPLRDDEGNVVGILGTYENITERKQVEENLKKLNETLEARVEERTAQLRETETRLSRLADNVPGMIYQFQFNPNGKRSFPYVSSGCQDIYEVEQQKIKEDAEILFAMVHPDDIDGVDQTIATSAQTLQNWEYEWRIITPSGKYKWLKGVSKPHLQPDKSILWDGCLFDITKQKQAEDALQKLNEKLEIKVIQQTLELHQAQARLKKLTDNIPGMIYEFCLTPEGRMSFPYVSSGCREIYEIEPSRVYDNVELLFAPIHSEDLSGLNEAIFNSAQTLNDWKYEYRITTPSKKNKWLKGVSRPELQPDNSIIWYGCAIDITDKKKVEAKILEQEQFLRSIYDGLEHNVYVLDIESDELRCVGINSFGMRIMGLPIGEVIGKTVKELFGLEATEEIYPKCKECIETGVAITYEENLILKGQEMCFFTTLNPIKNNQGQVYRLIGTSLNITKRKKAEIEAQQKAIELENTLIKLQETQTQLIQTEKMSGLGQMVAGVAHEINNPANFIHANVSFIDEYSQDLIRLVELYQKHYPSSEPEIQSEIDNIELDFLKIDLQNIIRSMGEGTRRIREIVLSLRNFSRLDEAEFKEVNIHEGIDSTLMILQNRLKPKSYTKGNGIEIIKEYNNLPLVECYPSQLNQVFMNILVNAIDALEEAICKNTFSTNFIPQITIYTKQINKNTAQICISDNGSGIPNNVISKLFDPFFTTKEVGKGTGLGLSVSYQIIVEKHGGKLFCKSAPGKGTSFIIEIPINHG